MNFINEFWTDVFPQFKDNYEFIYVLLDISTIITIIRIFIMIPLNFLSGGSKLWND